MSLLYPRTIICFLSIQWLDFLRFYLIVLGTTKGEHMGTIGEILRDYLKQQGFADPNMLPKMVEKSKGCKNGNNKSTNK